MAHGHQKLNPQEFRPECDTLQTEILLAQDQQAEATSRRAPHCHGLPPLLVHKCTLHVRFFLLVLLRWRGTKRPVECRRDQRWLVLAVLFAEGLES